jgi:hypothetical protein
MKKLTIIIGSIMLMLACNTGGNSDSVPSDTLYRDSIDKTDVDKPESPVFDSSRDHKDTSSYGRMSNKAQDSIPD